MVVYWNHHLWGQQLVRALSCLHFCRAPDTARIKSKMMYASTKDYFKGFLEGLNIEMQVNDVSDLEEAEIEGLVRATLARK
jgi:Cofilin/tropomyosin-type actin-binding protein